MNMATIATAAAITCVASCAPTAGNTTAQTDGRVTYLCIGMETSKRFGECPGCEKDAKTMTSIFKDELGYSGTTLCSSEATKSKVVSLLKDGIAKTPEDGLFIFSYSGHGGQEALGGKEPDGSDSEDEYLCLYDTYMLDDEIWEIVSECRGRVFLYFDCCHSATMYRSIKSEKAAKFGAAATPAVAVFDESGNPVPVSVQDDMVQSRGFTFRIPSRRVFKVSRDGSSTVAGEGLRMLCWSGCKEAEYSYGSAFGGTMTLAVKKYWEKGLSYETLWNDVSERVVAVQPGQTPVKTNVGGGFEEDMEAFR